MVVLNIYNSEDFDCTNELCSLNNGHHFVGRETPIVSNNKRISRKHARISVHKNGAIIESLHVNPTFFKSSIGGSIQLLKEHESLSLNNGDCFALVEDATWFKVKIICENNEESLIDVQSNNSLSNKRRIDEDNSYANKRIKTEIDNSIDSSIVSNGIVLTPNTTVQADLDSTTEELNVASVSSTVNGTDVPNCNNVKTEEPDLDSTLEELDVAAASSTVNGTLVPNCNNIKTEQPPIESSTLEGEAVAFTLNNNNLQNPINIKTEKPDDASEYLPMPLPLLEIKRDIQSDQPSSSTNDNIPAWKRDHPYWRRDRCWYGKDCYRKNPIHKENFSHPVDNDYDSDPNDSRIVCPFGRGCYRLNIEHRRQFKHFGKPAPKPNIVHVNGCACCHNSRNKPGYESDCDDTDPE